MPAAWLTHSRAAASTRAGLRLRSRLAASRLAAFPNSDGIHPGPSCVFFHPTPSSAFDIRPWAECVFGTDSRVQRQRHTNQQGGTWAWTNHGHRTGRKEACDMTALQEGIRLGRRRGCGVQTIGDRMVVNPRFRLAAQRDVGGNIIETKQAVSRGLRLRVFLRSARGGLRRAGRLVLQAMRAAPHVGRGGNRTRSAHLKPDPSAGEIVRHASRVPSTGQPLRIWRPSNERTRKRRRNGHGGTVHGTERNADSEPAAAPGQLRAGLVLDDDGHLSRRQVGRAGVPAATGRQRHRGQVPHRGLLGRRGDTELEALIGLPIWTAYEPGETTPGQGP